MDTTDNLDLRYPQCDPPLTKDASDIIHLKFLADDVDAAVQEYADLIIDRVVRPDAVRLNNNTPLVSTVTDNVIALDTLIFDNTPGNAMTDLTNGVIRIITSGWYLLGVWAEAAVATDVQMRTRFIANGDPITNFGTPAGLAQAGQQHATTEEVVHLVAGDGVTVATRMGSPGTSVSYTCRMWAVLVVPDA